MWYMTHRRTTQGTHTFQLSTTPWSDLFAFAGQNNNNIVLWQYSRQTTLGRNA
jgi:hypothetical protein